MTADQLMDKWTAELRTSTATPTMFAIGTPRTEASSQGDGESVLKAITDIGKSNRDPSASVGAGRSSADDFDKFIGPAPRGPRPSTPRRSPSSTPKETDKTRKLHMKSRSPSSARQSSTVRQMVVELEGGAPALKRKLDESVKENEELKEQLRKAAVESDLIQVDHETTKVVQAEEAQKHEDLKGVFRDQVDNLITENNLLKAKLDSYEKSQTLLQEKVKSGRADLESLIKEKEVLKKYSAENDEKYRAQIAAVDKRIQDSTQVADASRRTFEQMVKDGQDKEAMYQYACLYINQLHGMLAQYQEHFQALTQEAGTLRNNLEMLRNKYYEDCSRWENWHNADMQGVCYELNQAKHDRDQALVTKDKAVENEFKASGALLVANRKLEEESRTVQEFKRNVDSLEMKLRKANEAAGTPPGVPASDASRMSEMLQKYQHMRDEYESRIEKYREELAEADAQAQIQNNAIEQMQLELHSNNVKADLLAADLARGTAVPSASVGAGQTEAGEGEADAPKRTLGREMLDKWYEHEKNPRTAQSCFNTATAMGPGMVREPPVTDDEDEDFQSVVDQQGPSEAGSIAPVSQVGSDLSTKIPGRKTITEVMVPKLPEFNELREWVSKIGRNLHVKSLYADRLEIPWIKECFDKNFEQLADPGHTRFRPMDAVLIAPLEQKLNKELKREYSNICREYDKSDRVVGGRQIIKLVIDSYYTANSVAKFYSYETLQKLPWYGDDRVPEFMDAWTKLVDNLQIPLKMEEKRDLLYDKLKGPEGKNGTKLFVLDLQIFERERAISIETKADQPEFTLDFLWTMMRRHIAAEKEKKILAQRMRPPRGRGASTPAAPAPEKPDPKGKKPRDPSRSKQPKKGEGGKGGGKGKESGKAGSKPPNPTPQGEKTEICWFHQAKHHGVHERGCKYTTQECRKIHGPPISRAQFEAMTRPSSTSRGPSKGANKGGGKGGKGKSKYDPSKTFFIGKDGKKVPYCCTSFLKTGVCDWETRNPGKKCRMKHFDEAGLQAETKKINSEPAK